MRKNLKMFNYETTNLEEQKAIIDGGKSLFLIKNPSYEIEMYAVQKNGLEIKYVRQDFISFDLAMTAIRQDPFAIEHIINQYEKLQMEAVKLNIKTIRLIARPTKEVQLYVLSIESKMFPFIKNPCEDARLIFAKSLDYFGSFVELNANEDVCTNCCFANKRCVYLFSTGIFDECPRFLEHLALQKEEIK